MAKNTNTIQTLSQLFSKYPLRVSLEKQRELYDLASVVATRHHLPEFRPQDLPAFDAFVITALRERVMDYSKKTPNDCGTDTRVELSVLKRSLSFVTPGLGTATTIAGATAGATAGITTALGVATAGIGLALAPILAIFAHHSQAVSKEQATLCSVSSALNSSLPTIDDAVASGQLKVEEGLQMVKNLVSQFKSALEPIRKTCNFACGTIAMLDAVEDYGVSLYPAIAPPIVLMIPGAPDAVNNLAQASVNQASELFSIAKEKLSNPALLAAGAVALVTFWVLGSVRRA
jgi:hypothetical protein